MHVCGQVGALERMPRRRFQHTTCICERITDAKSRCGAQAYPARCGAYPFRRTRSRSQHAMGRRASQGASAARVPMQAASPDFMQSDDAADPPRTAGDLQFE
eukprot:1888775-Prymnesium_polylepis.1